MATAFTHGFIGIILAPLAPKRIPRLPLYITLLLLPILPDLDILAFNLGIPYSDPFGHRGFTHSILFAFIAGYASTLVFWRFIKPTDKSWFGFGLLFSFVIASHGILDAFTDAGLGVAFGWPFDNSRYFFPWRPLATSPIGISSFFNGDAIAILKNEFLWVWLPITTVSMVIFLLKKLAIKLSKL